MLHILEERKKLVLKLKIIDEKSNKIKKRIFFALFASLRFNKKFYCNFEDKTYK